MTRDAFARELMLEELHKEQGRFVTLRIIDRLLLLYAPLFDRELLQVVAERINSEEQEERKRASGSEGGKGLLDTLKVGAARPGWAPA